MMRTEVVVSCLFDEFSPRLRAQQLGPPNPPDKQRSVEVVRSRKMIIIDMHVQIATMWQPSEIQVTTDFID